MVNKTLKTSSFAINLSIAAPAFNEDQGIHNLISNWYHFLKNHSHIATFEIIICNDGSQDKTGHILDELATIYPELSPIHLTKNQGAAVALNKAISKTQYEWVLLLDTDGQFPIENLSIMLDTLYSTHANAILGIRNKKANFFARFGSKASSFICNLVHGSHIKDFNTAFKLVSGPLLRSLVLEAKRMNYSTEITSRLLEARAIISETIIEHCPRNAGKSNIKLLRDSWHRLLFVFYIALRQLLRKLGILDTSHQ